MTTATKENALTEEERDAFLRRRLVGRLATNRSDGWWHVTPIWYAWEDGRFYLSLGNTRRHLKNLRRDHHVTLCVDVDPRINHPSHAPRSVMCFGLAELLEDEARGRAILEKIEIRYIGGTPLELEEALWFDSLSEKWLTW